RQRVISAGQLVETTTLPTDSENVLAVRYAPQLALLQKAQAFINHGGANSVMEALASGVPMLLSPFCNDQFHSAYFVERSGAGLCLNLQKASVEQIGDALHTLLNSVSLRERVEQLRASYAVDGSAQAARL